PVTVRARGGSPSLAHCHRSRLEGLERRLADVTPDVDGELPGLPSADIRVEDQGRAVRAVGEAGVARVVEELEAAGATRLLAAPVRIRRIDDEVVVPQVEIAVDVGRLETPLVPRDAAVLGTDVRLDPDRLIDP